MKQLFQKKILACYYAFFVNGMMVLMVGAILPYLISDAKIDYSTAGGFLSAFAIGNLMASFINPICIKRFGKKVTVILFSAWIPIGLFVLTWIPPVAVMYLVFILMGIGRGSVSIFNNAVVNDENPGNPIALNILHTLFALGAFLAPFMTSLYIAGGFTWKAVVNTVMLLLVLALVLYQRMELKEGEIVSKKEEVKTSVPYYKSVEFYVIGGLLFFYLGVENCVNGWFVTYFKEQGIMSEMYATNLVSIVWLFVMLGRLMTAYCSKFVSSKRLILINCIGTALFFVMLIATSNLIVITLAIIGLGFFLAGIYPTCLSQAGTLIQGSSSGMSMLLAIAALGGILAPQVVGIIADKVGLTLAIGFLSISVVIMVIFSTALQKSKGTCRK